MCIERNLIFFFLFISLLVQLSPVTFSFLSYPFLIGLFVMLAMSSNFVIALKKIEKNILLLLVCVVVCLIPSLWLSAHIQSFTCISFFSLILLFLLHFRDNDNPQDKTEQLNFLSDVFYFLFFLLVIINIGLHMDVNGVVASIDDINGGLTSDKNYMGVAVFLTFLYANKRKHLSGILLGWFYCSLTESRGYFLMLGLFYLVKYLSPLLDKIIKKIHVGFFMFFLLSFIMVSILSFIWVFRVSSGTLDKYHESLNDASNRMRFVANLKALQMLSEFDRTLFWGYSKDLQSTLGIERNNYSQHPRFMGVRLVVAHNSLINSWIRMGIIPGTIYLYLLAQLLNKYRSKDKYAYLFPYIINAMFLASLFYLYFLIFWIVVLEIPKAKTYRIL